MNIRNIIGQLFMVGFHGHYVQADSPILDDIGQRNLGGVILFDKFLSAGKNKSNIVSCKQASDLCSQLQAQAQTKLFIAVDQEGGLVQRFKEHHGFPRIPPARDLGKDASGQDSFHYAILCGRNLADIGVNINFAPVADVNINEHNPVIGKLGRSFSNNPQTVTDHCRAWLEGLKQTNILGCLKHFPGHGSSSGDSHNSFVDISNSWQDDELLPYRQLISENKVRAVMMGHLFHQDLDSTHPASLSHHVINDLLRKKLHYQGLVFTDDMQMKGITERYTLDEAIILSLGAGADQIVIGNNLDYDPDIVQKAVDAVLQALDEGRLLRTTLERAYKRIQNAKGG